MKQAAEEAASLAASQAVAAALAGVEARFAGIEEAHRQLGAPPEGLKAKRTRK